MVVARLGAAVVMLGVRAVVRRAPRHHGRGVVEKAHPCARVGSSAERSGWQLSTLGTSPEPWAGSVGLRLRH